MSFVRCASLHPGLSRRGLGSARFADGEEQRSVWMGWWCGRRLRAVLGGVASCMKLVAIMHA